uniref:Autophagy protein 5 n=1 Tax=Peronospora matthiolae TaxID=2874970 RepID=A0AAV1TQX4_9STRA
MPITPSASETLLKQRVWAGRIPVVFSLDPNEVTTLHAPRPFYAMVPRMSYLVSQTRDVVEYFQDAAPLLSGIQGGIWFEAKGVPLHWHMPFGLLRDLLCGPGAEDDTDLPWALTVHFLGFPVDVLLPCDNEQSIESHFMHSLKQATFLRMGSTKAVMSLPEAKQTQIWTSLLQSDFERYQEATIDLHLDGGEDASKLRHLPVRVHLDSTPVIQMPIAPLESGREKTLREVLQYLLPDLFPDAVSNTPPAPFQIVVHGISVPLDVSIVELYRNLLYADGFLYVVVLSTVSS